MSEKCVTVERDGRVATLVLDRPTVHNAVNPALVAQVAEACAALDVDPAIHVVIVTGRGRSFSAGLDRAAPLKPDLQTLVLDGLGDREALYRLRKPTIGAISGATLGAGCELALCCDMLIADTTAFFSLPEVSFNGAPGAGGAVRLAARVGADRAMEICLTGRRVPSEEAKALGLVMEVCAPDQLQARARALADAIAAQPLAPLMLVKQGVRASLQPGLSAALPLQTLAAYACVLGRALPPAVP